MIESKNMLPKVSIIVPIYKVEPYLEKCVESILKQTFTDFELILVDDGSPDRCPEVCDEYGKKTSEENKRRKQAKKTSEEKQAIILQMGFDIL
mgnify:CR=1 FL=1